MASLYLLSFFFGIICVTARPDIALEQFKEVAERIETCTKKHGTDAGELISIVLTKSPVENKDMKCTIDCYLKEAGYLKEDGTLNWTAAAEKIKIAFREPESQKKAQDVLDKCEKEVNIEGKEECEIGLTVLPCLYKWSEANKLKIPTMDLVKPTSAES